MLGPLDPLISMILFAILLAAAFYIFGRVRSDYHILGKLSRPIAIFQVGYFCLYAFSSYLFLDSRLSHIQIDGWLLALAIVLMLVGFLVVIFSMPFLGRQSFGSSVTGLRTAGLYRYSRNPQLVGGFLFIVGYAMLWPSWQGAVWASLWIVSAHLMVHAEEAHLAQVYGDKYRAYCARTPRYLGILKK